MKSALIAGLVTLAMASPAPQLDTIKDIFRDDYYGDAYGDAYEDGYQTFQIGRPTLLNSTNLFPKWAAKRASLITVDYANLYEFSSDRESLSVSTYSHTTKASTLVSRISVMKKVASDETWVKLVTKSVAGCEQSYRCTVLHRRARHIIELELGPPTRTPQSCFFVFILLMTSQGEKRDRPGAG